MHYGTIHTEIWANFKDVAQEYYRYEIITRWWLKNPNVDETQLGAADIEWKTTIYRVDRDSSIDVMPRKGEDLTYDAWMAYMNGRKTSMPGGFSARSEMLKQHRRAVKFWLG